MTSIFAKLLHKALLGLELPLGARPSTEFRHFLPYSYPIMQTRQRTIEERNLSMDVGPSAPAPTEQPACQSGHGHHGHHAAPPGKRPSSSFLQLRYPFSTSPQLQRRYRQADGSGHDIALWLEDMDTFAADVGGRHCDIEKGDKKQVTAFLESFVWFDHDCQSSSREGDAGEASASNTPALRGADDMHLCGQVTWVGKSSMEVTLELWAHPADHGSSTGSSDGGGGAGPRPRRAVAMARFVMAARSLDLKHAAHVAPLELEGGADAARFALGLKGHHARQERRHLEKAKHPPTAEEVDLLVGLMGARRHELLSAAAAPTSPKQAASPEQAAAAAAAAQPLQGDGDARSVAMASTKRHHVATTTSRDVNTSGSTFGGHLLRLGYEHGLRVAQAHTPGRACQLVSMSEVAFLALVPIGGDLHLDGVVACVDGDIIRVHVTAWMYTVKQHHAHSHHHSHHHHHHPAGPGPHPAGSHPQGPSSGQLEPAAVAAVVTESRKSLEKEAGAPSPSHDHSAAQAGQHGPPLHAAHRTKALTAWLAFHVCGGGSLAPVSPSSPEEVELLLHAHRQHVADVADLA